jgi:hypothetical protein
MSERIFFYESKKALKLQLNKVYFGIGWMRWKRRISFRAPSFEGGMEVQESKPDETFSETAHSNFIFEKLPLTMSK